ncbi:hypothetical protein SCHPADRAFT_569961 [Schizopora paradoxa]|uniref:Uncharacterized protein n=1 Tax=Schizopora paradoxa TaxID=27342 RepID=A0A0H2RBW3_9AGAM|nr:hypothetical protein SCHPADRAFT_569961 [Schizopora paradoxa]
METMRSRVDEERRGEEGRRVVRDLDGGEEERRGRKIGHTLKRRLRLSSSRPAFPLSTRRTHILTVFFAPRLLFIHPSSFQATVVESWNLPGNNTPTRQRRRHSHPTPILRHRPRNHIMRLDEIRTRRDDPTNSRLAFSRRWHSLPISPSPSFFTARRAGNNVESYPQTTDWPMSMSTSTIED